MHALAGASGLYWAGPLSFADRLKTKSVACELRNHALV